ncbi:hypothetical protein DIPPA_18522 [Diplonema papillatum]|nr:hypothetical protein DIPPA_18522 [Diplonema papillatum]
MSRKPYLVGVAIVTILYIAAGAPFLAYMSHEVRSGLRALRDVNSDYSSYMVRDVNTVSNTASELAWYLNANAGVSDLMYPVTQRVSDWHDNTMNVSNDVLSLTYVFLVLWTIPLGLLTICCLLKACNVHRAVPDLVTLVTICVVGLIGISQATVGISGKITHDLCNDQVPATTQALNIMDSELQCGTDSGPLGGIKMTTELLKQTYVSQQSGEVSDNRINLRHLCDADFECGDFDAKSTMLHLRTIVKTSKLQGNSGDCTGCSILECTTMCDPSLQAITERFAQPYNQMWTGTLLIEENGAPWVDCVSFTAWIGSISEQTCNEGSVSKTLPKLAHIAIATLVVSLLVVGAASLNPFVYARATPAEAAPMSARLLNSPRQPSPYVYGTPVYAVNGPNVNCAVEEAKLPNTEAECKVAE